MTRIFTVCGLVLGTWAVAGAGTINTPVNLTTSNVYIGTCTGFGCTPTVSGTNVGGSFETTLFSTIAASGNAPTPNSLPQTVTTAGSGAVPFILAAQPGSPFDDVFGTANTTNLDTTLVMDLGTCSGLNANTQCGLFNVSDVYTMLQANLESFGYQGITVTLNGVTALGGAVQDVIDLTAGVDYRATSSAGTVTCTVANANTGDTACTGAGSQSDTAALSGTDNTPGGTGGNKVVVSNNVFGNQTAAGVNYYLDVQDLQLGTNFLGDYLNSITIANASPSGGKERTFLSGVTAASVATPEPDTIALFGIGLGLCAFWKIRIRRANESDQK